MSKRERSRIPPEVLPPDLTGPREPGELVYDSRNPDLQPANVVTCQWPFSELAGLLPPDFFLDSEDFPADAGLAYAVRLLARRGINSKHWPPLSEKQSKEFLTYVHSAYHDLSILLDALKLVYDSLEKEAKFWKEYVIEGLKPYVVTKFGQVRPMRQSSPVQIRSYQFFAKSAECLARETAE